MTGKVPFQLASLVFCVLVLVNHQIPYSNHHQLCRKILKQKKCTGQIRSRVLFTYNQNQNSICFVEGSCFIYVICVYLRIQVYNTISISDDVRCCLTVKRRVLNMEQELLSLPVHLSSPRFVLLDL